MFQEVIFDLVEVSLGQERSQIEVLGDLVDDSIFKLTWILTSQQLVFP